MKKIAFLSMDNLNGFECYDKLLYQPLKELGWDAEEVSWKKPDHNWTQYNAVIVRSTWDYQNDPERFFAVLDNINSQTHLENEIQLMKWNLNKYYLKELKEKNIHIVETIFENSFDLKRLNEYFDKLNSTEIVFKPSISANADNTFRIKKDELNGDILKLNDIFGKRSFLVQPFMENIIAEGEYSLFYFGGTYSHTILKKPKEKDFRVQEEHGGKLQLVDPPKGQKEISEQILSKLTSTPLYARIDLVRDRNNKFSLMELELIEPSLYFNMDEEAPRRFAEIFNRRMSN